MYQDNQGGTSMKQWYKKYRKSMVRRYYVVKDYDGIVMLSASGRFHSIKDVVEHVRKHQYRKKGTVISVCRVDTNCDFIRIKDFTV